MNWYYVENGQQAGPVSEQQLQGLVQQGRVQADTLLWHEGMANWTAAQQAIPQLFAAPAAAQPEQPAAPQAADPGAADPLAVPDVFGSSSGIAASLGSGAGLDSLGMGSVGGVGGEVMCCSCGNLVPRDQAIDVEGRSVCAACKPAFVQQMKEGVAAGYGGYGYGAMALNYAGFWIRFVAKFLDGLIMTPVNILLNVVLQSMVAGGVGDDPSQANPAMLAGAGLIWLLMIGLQIAYVTFFVGKFGGTPGKLICGLRVVTADGDRVTYLRAFARFWGEMVTGMTWCLFGFGYIMAGFHKEKCALHDLICNTRVVWK